MKIFRLITNCVLSTLVIAWCIGISVMDWHINKSTQRIFSSHLRIFVFNNLGRRVANTESMQNRSLRHLGICVERYMFCLKKIMLYNTSTFMYNEANKESVVMRRQ